ncbi:hypothetical protein CUS59_06435 [Enterococcus faecium]|nr:hypothetical protein CUS59_06435 [Enterococcus faecium]
MRNYFSVCFSNTQVRTLISQPLNKRCSKACICGNKPNQTKYEELFLFGCSYYLMQDSFFTTSR